MQIKQTERIQNNIPTTSNKRKFEKLMELKEKEIEVSRLKLQLKFSVSLEDGNGTGRLKMEQL